MSNEVLHLASLYADRYLWSYEVDIKNYEAMSYGALWLAGDVLEPGTPYQNALTAILKESDQKIAREEAVSELLLKI